MSTATCPVRSMSQANPGLFADVIEQVQKAEERRRREALITEHLSLVHIIAKRMSATLPAHVELDDLIQAGTLGLLDAVRKFDSAKHVSFGAYAKHRIRGAILDSLRHEDFVSRDMRREQKRIDTTAKVLEQQLNRTPTEPEVAAALNMDVDRLRTIQLHLRGSAHTSTSTTPNDDLPERQFPDCSERRPDSICARTELHAVLQKAVASLPERQRSVLNFYYIEEMTMGEIGAAIGVNESRVSQIHRAAVNTLERRLMAAGIRSAA